MTAKHNGLAVGWKWLAGILTSVLILGGGAWMTRVASESDKQGVEIAQLKTQMGEKAADVKEIRKDIDAIKDSQKRQETRQEKIDDKLDKLKDLIQDDRFKARPRAN